MSATPKLYFSPGACSLAPHLALEESGGAYEAVRVDFASAEQRSEAYLAINPKGRVPALDDGGFVVTENPAVLRYIARRFPEAGLWPTDPKDEARCLEWLAWIASTVHPAYAHIRRVERYATSEAAKADVQAKARETCRDLWTTIEGRLAVAEGWAAGPTYSVADIYLLVFWLWGGGSTLHYDMAADFPAWSAHARRVAARPAIQRVLEKEGQTPPA